MKKWRNLVNTNISTAQVGFLQGAIKNRYTNNVV